MTRFRALPGRWWVVAAVLALAGCVALPQAQPTPSFQLGAGAMPAGTAMSSDGPSVAVETPIAQGLLATDRILVLADGQRAAVAGARWDDRMPDMLRRSLARTLQATGSIQVVDAAQRAGRAQFALVTLLEAMEAEIQPDLSANAVASVAARLVRLPDREIVSTAVFTGTARAADDAAETLTRAIDEATAQALADLATWVVEETQGGV